MWFLFKCAVICFHSFCHLTVSCCLSVLSQGLCPYDVTSSVLRIVGHNGQKSVLHTAKCNQMISRDILAHYIHDMQCRGTH